MYTLLLYYLTLTRSHNIGHWPNPTFPMRKRIKKKGFFIVANVGVLGIPYPPHIIKTYNPK